MGSEDGFFGWSFDIGMDFIKFGFFEGINYRVV